MPEQATYLLQLAFLEGRIKELTDELTNAKPNSFNKNPWVDWHDGSVI